MKRLLTIVVSSTLLFSIGYLVAMSVHRSGAQPGGGGYGGYGGPPKSGGATSRPAAGAGTPVVTATVMQESLQERVSGAGVLEAEREIMVIARVDGEVKEFAFEEGAHVDEGATLCVIDEEPLAIAERAAEIDRDYNKVEYERLRNLAESSRGAVTQKEVGDARVAFERAEITLQEAKLRRSYARPGAPFAGVVVDRLVEKGSYVRAGDELFRLGDLEPLLLRLYLPERDVERLAIHQRTELRSQRDATTVAEGRVIRISPVVDRESLTVEVVTSYESVPDGVRPGSFGRVDIITRTHQDALLIPRGAIVRGESNDPFVYRVGADQAAERVPVMIGFEDDTIVEVKESALQAGDIVIVDGNRSVKDGDRVHEYRRLSDRSQAPASSTPGG
ncbi:MAG: efflux RND transporter periplasmic adaptor subunit [Planctomycetota bacterium]